MIRRSISIEIVITFRSRFQVTGRRPRLARASIVLPLCRPPPLAFDFDRVSIEIYLCNTITINIDFDRDLCNNHKHYFVDINY